MKTLNKDQALYCAKIFNDYFGQFNRIDEYMRDQKMSQLNDTISASLPGMGPETEIFLTGGWRGVVRGEIPNAREFPDLVLSGIGIAAMRISGL